jgi:hypothetical protein
MTVCTPDTFDALNQSGRREEICVWLGMNGIDPNIVSVSAPVTVEEDEGGQLAIRYSAFLLTEDGHKYVDSGTCGRPHDPNTAAREDRSVPCIVEPPAHWALDD